MEGAAGGEGSAAADVADGAMGRWGSVRAGSSSSSGSFVSEDSSVFVTVGLPVLGCRQEASGEDVAGLPAGALFGHQALIKCSTL